MVGLIHDEIEFLLPLKPGIQAFQVASDAVLAGNQKTVLGPNVTGPVMAGRTRHDPEAEGRDMRNHFRIGIGLERLRRLIQQHLAVSDPENLLFPVDGVF